MDNLRGSLLMVISMTGFAIEDMFIKLLSDRMPVGQILIILGLAGAIIFALMARAQGERVFVPEMFSRAVMLRNLGEMIAAMGYTMAIALTTLSSASAILQATPLAVTLGAALFMGAQVGWRRWGAILIGFMGVLMIVRPGLDGFQPASLLAVASVIGLAIRDLATRTIPGTMSSMQLSCYGFAALAPSGAILLAFSGGAIIPTATDWGLLACAVAFGVLGYYFIVGAMRIGDVAAVTPFRYTRLVFTLLLGVTILGERPDVWTLTGATVIIVMGLYTFMRERRLSRSALAMKS
ncbi:DMT family transporter [Roseovarius aestuarii]|nr:DMT family transporter [Roseovarius aestuarii]